MPVSSVLSSMLADMSSKVGTPSDPIRRTTDGRPASCAPKIAPMRAGRAVRSFGSTGTPRVRHAPMLLSSDGAASYESWAAVRARAMRARKHIETCGTSLPLEQVRVAALADRGHHAPILYLNRAQISQCCRRPQGAATISRTGQPAAPLDWGPGHVGWAPTAHAATAGLARRAGLLAVRICFRGARRAESA